MGSENYRIRFTPLSYQDLDEIDTYISGVLGNLQAAEHLLGEMEKSIDQLSAFPFMGAEVDDAYLSSRGYRKLVVENYLIFYLVNSSDKEVLIMRIVYGAREFHNLL